jgi:riboflavin kinase/FMN adenylyltransferase
MSDSSLPFPGIAGGSAVTVGTFDGGHLWHRDILSTLEEEAAEADLPSILVTFRPHPLTVVRPHDAPLLLTPGSEQLEWIAGNRAPDYVVVLPFTRRLASLAAEEFVQRVLIARYRMRRLVIGYDHGLGRGREGNVDRLTAEGRRLGFPVRVVEATTGPQGTPVSSSLIRSMITSGELADVPAALGRRYALRGQVVRGMGRGKGIGFPTLNISVAPGKLLPADGVYVVIVSGRGSTYGGMLNIGGRPTFGDSARSIEAHLFDAVIDWYGADVQVEFVSRIREVKRFSGPEALAEQLRSDAETARGALTQA